MKQHKKQVQESDLPKIDAPASGALAHIGITRLEQVVQLTEKELLQIHGVGPKAVRILKETLTEQGLTFKKT